MSSQKLKKDEQKRLKSFLDKFEVAERNQTKYRKKWDEYDKIYHGMVDLPEDIQDLLNSKLKVPWAWQQIETIIPRVMDPEIRLDFRPVESGDRRAGDILKIIINQQLNADHFVMRQRDFIQDAMVLGLGVGKVRMHQRKQTICKWVQDPENPGQRIKVEEERIVENRPSITYVDPYDFYWDPAATNDQNWKYVFHRSWLTKAELEQRAAQLGYRDVSLVSAAEDDQGTRGTTETTEEAEAKRQGKFPVDEGWFHDGTRMVVCNGVLLFDGKNPYFHGQFPFVCFSTQPNPRSLVGVSELEKIKELQIAVWIKDNQRIDTINYVLNFAMVVDPNIPGARNLKLHPGKVIHAVNGQRIEQLMLGAPAELAFRETESYVGAMQQMTGASPMFSNADIGAAGINNDTATGASIMQEEGNKRMAMKKLQFRLFVARAAKMMVQLDHQYLTPFEVYRLLGDAGGDWKPIAPEEIPMFLDVIPEAMSEVMGKMFERNSLIELINILGQMHGQQMLDGTYFDSKSIIERIIKAYDQDPVQSFRDAESVMSMMPPQPVDSGQQGSQAAPSVQDGVGSINEVMQ